MNALDCDNVHAQDPLTGRNALHNAAFFGHLNVVQFLVNEMKMNPDIKDKQGDLPIHDAIRFNHLDVVQFLGTHTNSRIRNMLDEKPVDTAISYGNIKMVKYIPERQSL